MKTKVKTDKFEYKEEEKEFTGLIFHCPNCDNIFHLHIAEVKLKEVTGNEREKI